MRSHADFPRPLRSSTSKRIGFPDPDAVEEGAGRRRRRPPRSHRTRARSRPSVDRSGRRARPCGAPDVGERSPGSPTASVPTARSPTANRAATSALSSAEDRAARRRRRSALPRGVDRQHAQLHRLRGCGVRRRRLRCGAAAASPRRPGTDSTRTRASDTARRLVARMRMPGFRNSRVGRRNIPPPRGTTTRARSAPDEECSGCPRELHGVSTPASVR